MQSHHKFLMSHYFDNVDRVSKIPMKTIHHLRSRLQILIENTTKHDKEENSDDADVTPNTKKVPFFSIASFKEQWRD